MEGVTLLMPPLEGQGFTNRFDMAFDFGIQQQLTVQTFQTVTFNQAVSPQYFE